MAGVRAKSVPRRDAEGRGASPLPCQGLGGGRADWGAGCRGCFGQGDRSMRSVRAVAVAACPDPQSAHHRGCPDASSGPWATATRRYQWPEQTPLRGCRRWGRPGPRGVRARRWDSLHSLLRFAGNLKPL